ncbi:MAG TPA: NADPH-dependent FMN reductase [Nitrosopumilaceae archaeon]|nr:NADPH-dependent FMN reductase [Nitrosopumilaceae archaeon]
MKVAVISASPRNGSNTKIMMEYLYNYAKTKNVDVKFIDLSKDRIDCYQGPGANYSQITIQTVKDVTWADVWFIGSPIYNSLFSSALKNLFEYINYKDTGGKTAGIAILGSGSISFTNVQNAITGLMSYFKVITNPKAVHMTEDQIKDGKIVDENVMARLCELVDETVKLAS